MVSRWNALAYILLALSWLVGAVLAAWIIANIIGAATSHALTGTPHAQAGKADLRGEVLENPDPVTGGVPPTYAVLGAMVEAEIGTVLLGGKATFYDDGPGLYGAAGPVLRDVLGGDPAFRGKRVTVCSGGRCVTVRLTDWCACGERGGQPTLIDLSTSAFRRLGPLSRGVLDVTIEIGGGPRPTLPATDTP